MLSKQSGLAEKLAKLAAAPNHAALYIALLIATLLVYVNTLPNDFVWDDEILIVNNHLIESWSSAPALFTQSRFQLQDQGMLGSGYYRPLISLSCVIDYSIWGLRPWGFHLTNVLIHCLNVLLFFHFFRKTFQDERAVFLAALLYAVSPLHTNAVSYIMGRTDLFATLFFLGAMLMYRSFRRPAEGRKNRYLVATLVFFCLSLLCKESAVTLPVVAILYDACFTDLFKREKFRWAALGAYIPFAVILVGYFFLRSLVITEGLDFAIHSFSDLTLRLATIAVSIMSYGRLLLFPLHLSYERSVDVVQSLAAPRFLLSLAGCVLLLMLMARLWRIDRKKSFCLLWFFITLAPTSNIVPVFPSTASSHLYIAEHFMYLPSMGLFILAGLFFSTAKYGGESRDRLRRMVSTSLTPCLAIVLMLSALTMRRNMDWRDSETFFESAVERNPNSVRMMNNLGIHYTQRKEYEKALKLFESILRLQPDSAAAYNNMAAIYEDMGVPGGAEYNYRSALSVDGKNVRARVGLGKILARTGRAEEAEKEFSLLVAQYPGLSVAHHELGRLLAARGEDSAALKQFDAALADSPSPAVVLNSIGIIHAGRGSLETAASYFERALEMNPSMYDVHVNLGNIYSVQNRRREAIVEYEKALASGAALPGLRERIDELRAASP